MMKVEKVNDSKNSGKNEVNIFDLIYGIILGALHFEKSSNMAKFVKK